MASPFISGIMKSIYRKLTESISDTILTYLSICVMVIGVSILILYPKSANNIDPNQMILLGIVTIAFVQRNRKNRRDKKEMEGVLKWLAAAPRTFQDNIQFPLSESIISPSGKYLASIRSDVKDWVLYLRTSYPVSTSAEIPSPDVPEEEIYKRTLRISSNGSRSIPPAADSIVRNSLISFNPSNWGRDWPTDGIWARSYRTPAASLGIVLKTSSKMSPASLGALETALTYFVQALAFSESNLRESRRWANRSDIERIRSALVHELSQELQLLRGLLPGKATQDSLFRAYEALERGDAASAKAAIITLLPISKYYAMAAAHLGFAEMYSEQLSQVKDLAQDWLRISPRAMPLHETVTALLESTRSLFPQLRILDPKGMDSTWVFGDPNLRGLIRNVLFNAAQASPEDGEIKVRVRKEPPWCILEIEDQGPGVPEGMEERIFDPEISLESGKEENHRLKKHMGLGLFFSRYVARVYGGDIRCIRGQGDIGACFEIRLVLTDKEAA
jgi:signal transduction histidine kinase